MIFLTSSYIVYIIARCDKHENHNRYSDSHRATLGENSQQQYTLTVS